ncbi:MULTISPECIES: VTT domain-containing protein [unclassified Janthinobacterium]|uniref:VTT domain-containing protein n=1 Tax=unclassified Janthinobacterium TaxID=2610881 RepID=UPI001622BC5B|nr:MULTISPECIES: VTT domain-containing protein [unclassified Janthinobacterium]MBB5370892.1 membrane protein DedA with SNARE-associated domain/rhodanese-related sulfurtransferase [Janthinobacterium sp. K2C7]MBB5383698.1 membrane protein DedA with SNARE-associated domain/rhodanese-related sulfurtransferase [Janthinobacterium sp. K2Li3]MBB5388203.1 membrane protein DedA with SNARE-associated domain/rhodanese-related sulfurtransferase [Janthinobacterium sp. K2E3]
MQTLLHLLEHYGVLIVFGIVLVEQLGLPIPAFPLLIVAGALAVDGDMHFATVLAAALAACLISDFTWFRAGRYFGKRILRLLCRISLSPDYCVSQTEDKFKRWGPKALVVSKFIPGFNTIAAPMSGAMGTSPKRFFFYAGLGGLLWSSTGILVGVIFHASVQQVLDLLSTMGSTALLVLATLLGLFLLYKYLERRRFRQALQIERIGIDELLELIEQGEEPLMVDARSATAQALEPAVPGAMFFNGKEPVPAMITMDKDRHIIVYCSCPNDVTAAQVAKLLHEHGFHRARPLHGGLDAWNAAYRSDLPVSSSLLSEGLPS